MSGGPGGWLGRRSGEVREPLPYCRPSRGEGALRRLPGLGESWPGEDGLTRAGALRLLTACAASLSLYPAWERRDWGMPGPEGTALAHGGRFLELRELTLRLGGLRHLEGRPSYLHASSGLTFALYQQDNGELLLVLGGTNTSHSDRQRLTFPSEVKQFQADLLNVVGRVPRLYRVADMLTLMVLSERGRTLPDAPLSVTGHSLGGGLAQYAGLMNGVRALSFSPTALGRGVLELLERHGAFRDPEAVLRRVLALSLAGDPIPFLGTRRLQALVLGEHLHLPLHAGVPRARRATSHGQIYPHLLGWLRRDWPDLPDALAWPLEDEELPQPVGPGEAGKDGSDEVPTLEVLPGEDGPGAEGPG